uniref:Component of IIS longevity pathway SMK-1, putative n=1 Tax=Theileria annulata TaxID=5874 RepID=A0A3B0NF10_THEAN
MLKNNLDDSELMKHNVKMEHVKFFREFVRHHQVVPLNNTLFYELIQANYRINYLKDVVLPRHLDEFSIQRINSTLFSNMAEIMNIILNEENNFFELLKSKLSTNYMAALFLRELLLVTRSTNLISQTDRNSLILMVRNYQLLNELTGYLDGSAQAITIYRETLLPLNLQSNQYYHTIKRFLTTHNNKDTSVNGDSVDTNNVLDKVDEYDAFDFIENLENDNDNGSGLTLDRDELRPNLLCTGRHKLIEPLSLVIEIFHICQEIFPAILRSAVFIDAEVNKTPKLFLSLCDILLRESNEGLQSQTREIISRLLDPKSMDLPDKDEVCNLFYDKGVLDYLMSYLTTGYPDMPDKKEEVDTITVIGTNNATTTNTISNNNLETKDENGLNKDGERRDNKEVLKEAPVPTVTSELRVNAILNIMELLCLCAREHKHRFKLRILSQKIPLKLIKSSMCPYDKFLVIGSIKFIKVCIQMKVPIVIWFY